MTIKKISDLFCEIENRKKRRLVVVNAVDEHTLLAVAKAAEQGIIIPILTGDKNKIYDLCEKNHLNINDFQIFHAENEHDAANVAMKLVNKGKADIIMKGLISTDKYMKAILNKEYALLEPKATLSHITLIENPNYHKLLLVSDVAVIPVPTLAQKVILTEYLINASRSLGIRSPKVAFIAATELVLPSMTACTEAAELVAMHNKEKFSGAFVAGPMALDVAVDKESAEMKKVKSPVAGDADCLLFPNIEAGNVFYKMNTKMCKSKQAAIVVGAKVPVVLSSRGDSIDTKLNSIALAAILCE